MSNRTNLNTLLLMSVFLLAMASTSFAEMLFPMHVGKRYEYERWVYGDETTKWTVVMEFVDKMTVNSLDYYHLQVTNYNNDGAIQDEGYVRSTEEAVYGYNPIGDDSLQLQKARVGTMWILDEPESNGYDYKVIEIVAIERVTVPYGTFNKAYVDRRFKCVDPADLSLGCSPDWYTWTVPGIGIVREVDFWVESYPPPLVEELVSISSSLEDIITDTLNFFDQSVTNGDLVGVGKGKGKKQLKDMKKMLETAAELIEDGFNEDACEQLTEAHLRCDGNADPPDYVAGAATATLADMIQDVIDELGCE